YLGYRERRAFGSAGPFPPGERAAGFKSLYIFCTPIRHILLVQSDQVKDRCGQAPRRPAPAPQRGQGRTKTTQPCLLLAISTKRREIVLNCLGAQNPKFCTKLLDKLLTMCFTRDVRRRGTPPWPKGR